MNWDFTNLDVLCERFDAFLLDQFGVLLHGDGAYPYAAETVKKLNEKGKLILMLSNSGKRAALNEARLLRLGFDQRDYLGVMSSGEAAYSLLNQRIGNQIDSGTKVFIISRDGDTSSIDGLALEHTKDIRAAGLIILAGSQGDVFPLDHYERLLTNAAEKDILCLCTNPDMMMLTADGLRFGAGKIAKLYEQLGGSVEWIGKPHPLIYEMAGQILASAGANEIICIGDSPAHDIVGGQGAGFKTALVRTGIHEEDTLDDVIESCADLDIAPDYLLPKFEF